MRGRLEQGGEDMCGRETSLTKHVYTVLVFESYILHTQVKVNHKEKNAVK